MSTLLNKTFFSNLEIDGAAPSAVEPRSLESGPLTAASLIAALGGGTATKAGPEISENNALTMSAVWAAVRVLSHAIATLPLNVRKKTPTGSTLAEASPAHRLLSYRPNPYMSAFTFFDTLMGHVTLWGNAYARIIWNGGGQPAMIVPLMPNEVTVARRNARLVYSILARGEEYAAEEIIHIPGPGFDGIKGYSVISYAREELGLGKAVSNFGSEYFGSGATMKGVLEVAGSMKSDERTMLGQEFDRINGGRAGSNRTAVISNGTKYNRLGIPPEDSQFLETRRFGIGDVARWFGVPVHMLGDLERATFSNIEELNAWFLQQTVTPWATRIEQEFDYKLFGFSNSLYCKFDETQLRRADLAKRQAFYASGRQWGYLKVNEIRESEGYEQVEGGDVLLQPANMQVAGEPPPNGGDLPKPDVKKQLPAPTPEPDPAANKKRSVEEMEPVLLEAIARMNRKERNIRERQTGEKLAAQLEEHRGHVVAALKPALSILRAEAIAEKFAMLAPRDHGLDDAADLALLKELLE